MNKSRKTSSTTRTSSRRKNTTPLNKKNGTSGTIIEAKMFPAETEQGASTSTEVNALTQYLDEVGRHPLLTIEQEQALSRP